MALVSARELLQEAVRTRKAVGAFNFYNLETLLAVTGAATRGIILQTTESTINHCTMPLLMAMVREVAVRSTVALHLDHATSLDPVRKCVEAGYTSIMIDGSKLPYDQNVALTREAVQISGSIPVEGELGRIGRDESVMLANFTDPDQAADFVRQTGVSSLAVSIGNSHGFYQEEVKLDFARLEKIQAKAGVPLVLHGGSGIPDADIRRAIAGGIRKINVATELKDAFMEKIRESGKEIDLRKAFKPAMEEVARIVRHKIEVFST